MESTEVVKTDAEADLFHRPTRLMRLASLANVLSWVILVLAIIYFGVQMYSLVTQVIQVAGQYSIIQLLPAFFQPFVPTMVALFLVVLLHILSEGIYLMMDIEENTRK